ncbi:tRNA-modifying protein YgfZ [uncultured Gammaproteobacteria bacterium]|nr:tRNA-modifying protein YgfZ [uncultured Gammaproteobacteria bacterium]
MITQLNNRVLLKLTGKDVQGFLQGQFSNDIAKLEEGIVQLNAYCQHQGKIMALIWVMKKADEYYLSFPQGLSEEIVKKLTMFKMMSDVVITDITNEIIQLGVVDEMVKGAFKLNNQQSVAFSESIDGFELSDEMHWQKTCIDNEVPEVELITVEKFVPQLLNLDINETGVSFTKGCYPGQEVVARLHYLGKSKRRMRTFECEGDVSVGDELIALNSTSAKACGIVVRCVKLNDQFLCLATVEIAYEDDTITLNNAEGTLLTRIHDD